MIENILAIIVLYKQKLSNSVTFIKLENALNVFDNKRLDIFVYDNSPQEFEQDTISFSTEKFNIKYERNISNAGVSLAYNKGAEYARSLGKKWLLLLDQDSELPTNYLDTFLAYVEKYKTPIVYVPKIEVNNKIISPARVTNSGLVRFLKSNELTKDLHFDISALNTGVFISTDFIHKIGGFSPKYPLDMLDHWLFKIISQFNETVVLLPITMRHDLSVLSKGGVSNERYGSILNAEKIFLQEFGSVGNIIVYKLRLLRRFLLLLLNGNKNQACMCLRYISHINQKDNDKKIGERCST